MPDRPRYSTPQTMFTPVTPEMRAKLEEYLETNSESLANDNWMYLHMVAEHYGRYSKVGWLIARNVPMLRAEHEYSVDGLLPNDPRWKQ